VQFVTLHYTAGSEGPTSAESGAQYDKNRTDGTSCHAFFDSQGPGLQEVPFGDRSHSAFYHGNEIGVHFEICGTIQTREQWLDATSMATLKTCAAAVAYTCDALGLAKRRLSVAETRAAYYNSAGSRPTGINDHATVTLAFPEDGGDHMDVGTAFPWDVFMDMVTGGANPSPGPLPPWEDEDNDMHTVRSGDSDGSIYLVPGYVQPQSGKMAAFSLGSIAVAQAYQDAGVKRIQLPSGMSVGGSGFYDIQPKPWPPATVNVDNVSVSVGDLEFTGKITPAGK
jgi:hypothetical protein